MQANTVHSSELAVSTLAPLVAHHQIKYFLCWEWEGPSRGHSGLVVIMLADGEATVVMRTGSYHWLVFTIT